jgi:glycosyltransferase involved in cell wall biosynthesis
MRAAGGTREGSSPPPLSILALEPWLGGSHRLFLEQWQSRSRHRIEILGLAPRHWRWRMRGAAWELARDLSRANRPRPDGFFASDYLDLASFYGLLNRELAAVPSVVYFHESQLAYCDGNAQAPERDEHFAFSHVLACLRAERVVFNSRFHRDGFQARSDEFLSRLPRPTPRRELEAKLERAAVVGPGVDVDSIPLGSGAAGNTLRLVFNHRLEHDKDPLAFLRAAARVRGVELVLLGERYRAMPEGVGSLLADLGPRIVHNGFVPERGEYARLLGNCDVVVSTSRQEFFGISVLEAAAAGCHPLLPNRLSYPELIPQAHWSEHLYGDKLEDSLERMAREAVRIRAPAHRSRMRSMALAHDAQTTAQALDEICAEAFAPPGRARDGVN